MALKEGQFKPRFTEPLLVAFYAANWETAFNRDYLRCRMQSMFVDQPVAERSKAFSVLLGESSVPRAILRRVAGHKSSILIEGQLR